MVFSGTPVFCINKTDHHDITEIFFENGVKHHDWIAQIIFM
jgi:hypothetical protein